jgi:hypothetical protein
VLEGAERIDLDLAGRGVLGDVDLPERGRALALAVGIDVVAVPVLPGPARDPAKVFGRRADHAVAVFGAADEVVVDVVEGRVDQLALGVRVLEGIDLGVGPLEEARLLEAVLARHEGLRGGVVGPG